MSGVREAYDALPWPAPGTVQGPALPEPWLFAPVGRDGLHHGARILVAGCGAGAEVASFAARYPGAEVVGVDLSPVSITHARRHFPQHHFELADLASADLSGLGRFELISCHAVADYVPDAPALLRALAARLADHGVLYLGTNSLHHPGARIREAMGRLGLPRQAWSEGPQQRAGLGVVHSLLGATAQIPSLPQQPPGLLAADVFPAFSHAADLASWCGWASAAGLQLAGSLATLWALPGVPDRELPLLYNLDRGGLAELVEGLQRNPVLQLVFCQQLAPTPPWSTPQRLWAWRPRLHPQLGREQLPALQGDWMMARFVALQTPGLPELRLALSAWMLEFFRRCEGQQSVATLRAEMPARAHDAHLQAALYRFWQAGLVQLSPPESAAP